MRTGRLCSMVAPGAAALLFSSLLVNSVSFAEDRCVCNLPESVKCYWKWYAPTWCSNAPPCFASGGSAANTCGAGVRRNPWSVATSQQAPSGQTAYAVDSCNFGGVTAGGSMTDYATGKLVHLNRCDYCRGRVSVTMSPSFNTCADAYDPPSNCKAYGLMQAIGTPVQPGHGGSGLIVSAAGVAASGHPTAPTVQFAVGIGEQPVQVTLTQSPSSPYSKVPVTSSNSRTWQPDVEWVNLRLVGSAVLQAFADGWIVGVFYNVGGSAARIPHRGHWNVDFVLECVGTCGRRQEGSWDKGPMPSCPASLP